MTELPASPLSRRSSLNRLSLRLTSFALSLRLYG
jgi:hypothetical protein